MYTKVFLTKGRQCEGLVVKNLPCNAGDMDSNPDLGRSHMLLSNSACEEQLLGPGAREPMGRNWRVSHSKRFHMVQLRPNSAKK